MFSLRSFICFREYIVCLTISTGDLFDLKLVMLALIFKNIPLPPHLAEVEFVRMTDEGLGPNEEVEPPVPDSLERLLVLLFEEETSVEKALISTDVSSGWRRLQSSMSL